MPDAPTEIFQRYIWRGAMTRNADALAELFTTDGVIESPFVPVDHPYPRRMEGRDAIRTGMAAFYERSRGSTAKVNTDESRYVLHTTTDPDVFIAEIDTVLDTPDGTTTVSLVQIFRVRDGKIALLRDYFAPEIVD